jgi:ribosomal protein S7
MSELFAKDTNYYYYLFFLYNMLFFKCLIFSGKKLKAFHLFLELKFRLKRAEKFDPFFIFLVAMMRVSPQFALSALKLSGIIYWVPISIYLRKKIFLSVKWVVKLIRLGQRKGKKMEGLVKALILSIYNKGTFIVEKKKFYSKGIVNRHLLRFFS